MSGSPLLLAVECATRTASVALVRGGDVLSTRSARSDQHHAESLLSEIDAALAAVKEAGVPVPFAASAFPLPNFTAKIDEIVGVI